MTSRYPGPLRREPLAVELHNTLYAVRGEPVDGLETVAGLRTWIAEIADRLPVQARDVDPSRRADFIALRTATREALHAADEGAQVPATALDALNDAAGRAPTSVRAVGGKRGRLEVESWYHVTSGTDIALAAFAADAIQLLAGPDRGGLRVCGAPGCVLMFLKDHPRRRWCSSTCGNRARQARHYERTRRARG